jgi:arylsulfatase A-like enzyme
VLIWSARTTRVEQEEHASPARGTNLLLLTVDTLRRDEVGFFAGGPSITPSIDSLATEGAAFLEATSCAPWTLSSLAAIHTGHYSSTTGVFTGKNRLAPGFQTLASILTRNGYHTRAIGRNTWLKPVFGLAQGFEVYDSGPVDDLPSTQQRRLLLERLIRPKQIRTNHVDGDASGAASRVVIEKALAFLRGYTSERPFFLWLHINNVHAPYEPKGDYLPAVEDYSGPFTYTSGTVVRLRIGDRLTESDKTRLKELYQGEIRYADRLIGQLLSTLRQTDLARSTVVVFASDHGEEFWDHGSVMHGHTLYEELLRVPLVFSWQDGIRPGQRISTPCSLIDIVPTVLTVLGVRHVVSFPGMMLLENQSTHDRARFAEGLEFFDEQKSVTLRGWKLVASEDLESNQLFYLPNDPNETINLVRERPEMAAELTDTLVSHLQRCRREADRLQLDRAASAVRLTARLRDQLRAQGYIE